jgi:hypothetical protein
VWIVPFKIAKRSKADTAMKSTMNRVLLGGGLIGAVLAANGGCVNDRHEHDRHERVVEVRRSPERVVVEVERRPEPSRQVVIVQEAPPPAETVIVYEQAPPTRIVERRSERPSPRHQWINGYWVRNRGGWVWVSGQWRVPPRAEAVWVEPRWEHHDREFHFSLGYWR